MKTILTYILLLFSVLIYSQDTLTLADCYHLLYKNYPLTQQAALLEKQQILDIAAIKSENLPTIEVAAQTTYQSAVTQLPINLPNMTVDPLNKDQYKATLTMNQLIYAGGLVEASLKAKKTAYEMQLKQVDVKIYQLKTQINQLYYSILLQQEKKNLLLSKKELLTTKLNEVKAGVKFGVLLPSSDSVIETELLKIEQQLVETQSYKSSLIQSLATILGTTISENTKLETTTQSIAATTEMNRPELTLFSLQKENIQANETLLAKSNAPKIAGFATSGYGNPGLNALDNSFQTFYMVGVKLNWTVFDWNTNKKQRESLKINKEIIDTEKRTFKLQTQLELDKTSTEINKITKLIPTDKSIIELQKNIVKTAASQFKNGVITASAYLTEVTNLYEAENQLATHNIQLLLSQSNYNTIKGN